MNAELLRHRCPSPIQSAIICSTDVVISEVYNMAMIESAEIDVFSDFLSVGQYRHLIPSGHNDKFEAEDFITMPSLL